MFFKTDFAKNTGLIFMYSLNLIIKYIEKVITLEETGITIP